MLSCRDAWKTLRVPVSRGRRRCRRLRHRRRGLPACREAAGRAGGTSGSGDIRARGYADETLREAALPVSRGRRRCRRLRLDCIMDWGWKRNLMLQMSLPIGVHARDCLCRPCRFVHSNEIALRFATVRRHEHPAVHPVGCTASFLPREMENPPAAAQCPGYEGSNWIAFLSAFEWKMTRAWFAGASTDEGISDFHGLHLRQHRHFSLSRSPPDLWTASD